MIKAQYRIGQKYYRLTIKSISHLNNRQQTIFNCLCDCGNYCKINSSNILRKQKPTKSCGCLSQEANKNRINKNPWEKQYNRWLKSSTGPNRQNISSSLTFEQWQALVTSDCYYCQNKPNIKTRAGEYIPANLMNGIDRMDSDFGYHIFNCVPCCKYCNYAKGTLHISDFLDLINKIFNHQNNN